MKKNKRRIKTFKNWLLARDSASRISTEPSYLGFFSESLEVPIPFDRYSIMKLFDMITRSWEFNKLQNFSGSNIGITKIAKENKCLIDTGTILRYPNISRFIIFLDPKSSSSLILGNRRILIEATTEEYSLSNQDFQEIKFKIPLTWLNEVKKADEIIETITRIIFKGLADDGTYKERFFNWWIERIIKAGRFYMSSLSFENSFVDWMKEANKEDVKQAYVDFFSDKDLKIKKMDKSRFYRDYNEIVKEVRDLIKSANIDLDGVDRGSSLLSRFDS